jgi:hypothetical protein
MEVDKSRIDKAVRDIATGVDLLLQDKVNLVAEVERLSAENSKLKGLTRSALERLDKYIIELENIRKNHVSSNNND